MRSSYSCGNSCVFGPPGGMGTNGGCHCLDEIRRNNFSKYREVHLGILELRTKVKELEDKLKEKENEMH